MIIFRTDTTGEVDLTMLNGVLTTPDPDLTRDWQHLLNQDFAEPGGSVPDLDRWYVRRLGVLLGCRVTIRTPDPEGEADAPEVIY